LGGNSYYALGADLRFPFPYLPKAHVQGHCFANAGSLISQLPFSKGMSECLQSFAQPSVAAGMGVLVRFAGFRMELNYCFPLKIGITDNAKPGFQFGIGMNFM
jgi:outer membrane protein insertion porin family